MFKVEFLFFVTLFKLFFKESYFFQYVIQFTVLLICTALVIRVWTIL